MSTRRSRNLHLMADYGSAGVWDHDGAPLDPARLPLSPKLRTRLADRVRSQDALHTPDGFRCHSSPKATP